MKEVRCAIKKDTVPPSLRNIFALCMHGRRQRGVGAMPPRFSYMVQIYCSR